MESVRDQYNIYKVWQPKKKSFRTIEEPNKKLKDLQSEYLKVWSENYKFSGTVTAREGSSCGINAKIHKNNNTFIQLDIKDCYQNITIDSLSNSSGIADVIKKNFNLFFIDNGKGKWYLPTGAPTSPFICNLILSSLDFDMLMAVDTWCFCINMNTSSIYTRYIDDLTFSFNNLFKFSNIKRRQREHIISENLNGFKWRIDQVLKTKNLTSHKLKLTHRFKNTPINITGCGLNNNNETIVPKKIIDITKVRLHKLACHGFSIDEITNGYLGHINNINSNTYNKLINKYYSNLEKYNKNNAVQG